VLRPASEDIIAKVLDGEAVIINLGTGTYYSADGVGGFIWELIGADQPLSAIAEAIAARYDVAPERGAADLQAFVDNLIGEGLVIAEVPACDSATLAAPQSAAKMTYEAPRLQVYRDMEDLLALDPPTPGIADLRWKG